MVARGVTRLLRFGVLLVVLLFLSGTLTVAQESEHKRGRVAEISIDSLILPGTAHYLERAIAQAAQEGAEALLVRLDTPGGLLESTQQMTQAIFASPVPVIVYISPSSATATSAGVFIAMAAHVAVMAPGTSIGAAHPVASDGSTIQGDMRTKAENMAVSMVRAISEQRGRNGDWLEKSVRESASVTEREALHLGVIDAIAENPQEALATLNEKIVVVAGKRVHLKDLSQSELYTIPISQSEWWLNIFANPNVIALLWLAATTALGIELYNPGAIFPGVVGVLALILALIASQIVPLNVGAVALLVVGAILIGAELWIPSGVLAVGGIVSLVLGSLYLVNTAEAPGMGVETVVIIPSAVVVGFLLAFVVWMVVRARRRMPLTGSEGLIGAMGHSLTALAPLGKVRVAGEIWRAQARSGLIEKGSSIQVLNVRENLLLEVRKTEDHTGEQ